MARIDVRVKDELFDMILAEAQARGISMGEVLSRAYAASKGDEELGILDKLKPGPKPEPRGHTNGNGKKRRERVA